VSFPERLARQLDRPLNEDITRYLHDDPSARYTGAWFDTYPAPPAPDSPVGGAPDRIDADDIIATTMLSIRVQANSNAALDPNHLIDLKLRSNDITRLLEALPADLELHTLDSDRYQSLLGDDDAPAMRLWRLLRTELNVPRTAAYKLLARKRPHLLPIRDSVLASALGDPPNWWGSWWDSLHSNPDIVAHLQAQRIESSAPWLSLLRIADIAIWMRQSQTAT
jgi:hypothetical protein